MDPLEKAQEVAKALSFPIAWGVDKALADTLGAFWEQERGFIQPTEFIVGRNGRILASTYSSSPVGRIDPNDALSLLKFVSSRQ